MVKRIDKLNPDEKQTFLNQYFEFVGKKKTTDIQETVEGMGVSNFVKQDQKKILDAILHEVADNARKGHITMQVAIANDERRREERAAQVSPPALKKIKTDKDTEKRRKRG